jgi:NAD(P)-dependent dehydrogenase (short-subunit alcohol dehydrogenase family)
MTLLRDDLLSGAAIAIAGDVDAVVRARLRGVRSSEGLGAPLGGLAAGLEAVATRLEALGATLEVFDHSLDEDAAEAWTRERPALRAVVYDAALAFGEGSADGLLVAVERGWIPIRAVVTGALIPAGTGGKVVLLAPTATAGPHAEAARAALENVARTLSVEWARYGITVIAIAPGAATAAEQIAELVAFLVSPAGDYFSGCRFELGAVEVA